MADACDFVDILCGEPLKSTTSSPLSTSITEPKPTSTLPPQTPTSLSTSPTPSDSTSSTPNQATPKTSSTSAQSSQDSVAGPIETSSSDSAADTSTAAVHGGSPIVSVNATHGATTFTGPSAIKQSSSSSISSSQPASGPSQSVNAPYAKSFWDKKAVVGGVFGTLGLIFLCAVLFLAIWIKRRRRARKLSHLRSKQDASVTPFIHVSEARRRGTLRSVFARILNKKSPATSDPRDADDGASVAQSEPPPYCALEGSESPALPAFSNADESVGFISNEKDIGVAT